MPKLTNVSGYTREAYTYKRNGKTVKVPKTKIPPHKRRNKKKFLYATIKDGSVKVTSDNQLSLLHSRKLPHTKVYRAGDGSIYKERAFHDKKNKS